MRLDRRLAAVTALGLEGTKLIDLDRSGIQWRLDPRLRADRVPGVSWGRIKCFPGTGERTYDSGELFPEDFPSVEVGGKGGSLRLTGCFEGRFPGVGHLDLELAAVLWVPCPRDQAVRFASRQDPPLGRASTGFITHRPLADFALRTSVKETGPISEPGVPRRTSAGSRTPSYESCRPVSVSIVPCD